MKIEINKILENNKKGILPQFKEEIEEIKDFDHLKFLTEEIISEIEKTIL